MIFNRRKANKDELSSTDKGIPRENSVAVGTAIIAVVLILLFGGLLYWMYSVRLLILPDSIAEIIGIGQQHDTNDTSIDLEELDGAVRNHASTQRVMVDFDIDYESLREAFLLEPEPDGVFVEMKYTYGGNILVNSSDVNNDSAPVSGILPTYSSSGSIRFYRNGSSFRISDFDISGTLTKVIIGDSSTTYYRDQASGEFRSIPRSPGITPESEAGLPSIDSLFEIVAQFPTIENGGDVTSESDETTGFDDFPEIDTSSSDNISPDITKENSEPALAADSGGRYENCELCLLKTDFGSVYFIAFDDTFLGTHEEYYVSLEGRVVLRQLTTIGDTVLFSCTAVRYSLDPNDFSSESLYSVT